MVGSIGRPLSRVGFVFQNHYPRFRGAPFRPFRGASYTHSFDGCVREAANYWPNHRRPAREGGFRGENRQRKALASRHVAWLN